MSRRKALRVGVFRLGQRGSGELGEHRFDGQRHGQHAVAAVGGGRGVKLGQAGPPPDGLRFWGGGAPPPPPPADI
ncbi:hypothetical protein, partial [Nocardia brasiliensis]|uniref:hypothetical protein n=1 Tax=Nocardia brasiliensis TaxID=37326 RepID=UPI0032AF3070